LQRQSEARRAAFGDAARSHRGASAAVGAVVVGRVVARVGARALGRGRAHARAERLERVGPAADGAQVLDRGRVEHVLDGVRDGARRAARRDGRAPRRAHDDKVAALEPDELAELCGQHGERARARAVEQHLEEVRARAARDERDGLARRGLGQPVQHVVLQRLAVAAAAARAAHGGRVKERRAAV